MEALRGRTAVITGAGAGLGYGLAVAAGELGMKLVLADISAERLRQAEATLGGLGVQVRALVTDVADPLALEHLRDFTNQHFGVPALLINNAGVETIGLSWEIPSSVWAKTIGINVLGVVNGVTAFAPQMIAAGNAYILNLGSIGSVSMGPMQTPYLVSKHAVLAFTECLALEMEMQSASVQVSAVLPGPVATRIFEDLTTQADPLGEEHRRQMQDILREHGLAPEAAGRIILQQMLEGRFWIATHPEMLAAIAADRGAYLAGLARPELSAEAKRMFGR